MRGEACFAMDAVSSALSPRRFEVTAQSTYMPGASIAATATNLPTHEQHALSSQRRAAPLDGPESRTLFFPQRSLLREVLIRFSQNHVVAEANDATDIPERDIFRPKPLCHAEG